MKAKKFRKYEEGGPVNDADLAAANASPDPIRELNRRKGWTKDADAGEPKAISFGESFRRAKDSGLKTFAFKGKQYTTKMASEGKASPATAKSSAAPSGKPDSYADRVAKISPPNSGDKAPAAMPDSAFDTMIKNNPSLAPLGRFKNKYGKDIQNTINAIGGVGRLVSGPGRAMEAGTKAGSAVRDLAVSETPVRFVGASGKRLMNAPRLGSESKGTDLATTGAGRGTARKLGMDAKGGELGATEATKAIGNSNVPRLGMNAKDAPKATKPPKTTRSTRSTKSAKPASDSGKPIPPSKAKSSTKFNDDEAGIEFRKGGKAKCYAKGGSVSSRADGCATKGKTNCRVY